jgi:hypothetical protein
LVVVVVGAVDVLGFVVVVDVAGTVVWTVGGGGVWRASFGGGFAGAVSSLPNICPKSCWAAGCATKSTSPRVEFVAAFVGSV